MNPFDGRLVSNFIVAALKGEDIEVYGDGKQTRSLMYVHDLVSGLIALMQSDCSDPVNIGTEDEMTVAEWAQVVNDLVDEMSKRLGVTFQWSTAEFASIITAVQAGRFDMGISAFGDFAPREKIVDEVDYTMEGTGIIVADGNPLNIQKISDACGHKAATMSAAVTPQ